MSPELITMLKAIGAVIGLVIAAPLAVVVVRASIFFGRSQKTQETLITSVDDAREALNRFSGEIRENLEQHRADIEDHGNRLTAIETARETEARLERRQFPRRKADRRPGNEDPAT